MDIDRIASITDVILGGWLVLSMFLWHDTAAQVLTTGLVGAGSLALGALSLMRGGRTWIRWLVAPLGVWLFLASFVLPGLSVATVINHLLVGTLLFGFSALPTGRASEPGGIL